MRVSLHTMVISMGFQEASKPLLESGVVTEWRWQQCVCACVCVGTLLNRTFFLLNMSLLDKVYACMIEDHCTFIIMFLFCQEGWIPLIKYRNMGTKHIKMILTALRKSKICGPTQSSHPSKRTWSKRIHPFACFCKTFYSMPEHATNDATPLFALVTHSIVVHLLTRNSSFLRQHAIYYS